MSTSFKFELFPAFTVDWLKNIRFESGQALAVSQEICACVRGSSYEALFSSGIIQWNNATYIRNSNSLRLITSHSNMIFGYWLFIVRDCSRRDWPFPLINLKKSHAESSDLWVQYVCLPNLVALHPTRREEACRNGYRHRK